MDRFVLSTAAFFGMLPWNIPIIILGYLGLNRYGVPVDNSWPQLFGDKSHSLFDLWSIQHFLVGALIGHTLTTDQAELEGKNCFCAVAISTFFIICFWETWEFGAELGIGMYDTMIITLIFSPEWFGGVEHWSNRLIADPILVLSGSALGHQLATQRMTTHHRIIQAFTGLFFVAHVASPDVMTIHHLLFG